MKLFLKKVAARLLLVLLSSLSILAALEITLRILSSTLAAQPLHDRPKIMYWTGEARLNPWGHNHPNPLRIAVVGDSITEGAGCQVYDTYGMRLESFLNLNDDQRPAMVKVWAEGGLSPSTECRYIDSILEWKPDLLIMGICLNDAEDSRKMGQVRAWRMETLPPPPPPGLAKVLRHTQAGTWLYQKTANRKARQGYLNYYRKLYDPAYSGWRHFVRGIRIFHEICKENGIVFVPVVFPLFSDVDHYPFGWVHAQIAQVLQANGIPYLDLLETFRGQSPERLQVIPLVDAHPNEIAHRQAAEAIFQFLLANKLVDAGYLPQHSSAPTEHMWKILNGFIHNVTAVDSDVVDQLIEQDVPPVAASP